MGETWFCYIARCRDGSFYAGIATDLVEREKEHNWGVGAAFTAKRRPVKIVWCEEFDSQGKAHRREIEIKGWSREKKVELIEGRRLSGRGKPFASEAGVSRQGKPFASLRAAQGKGE